MSLINDDLNHDASNDSSSSRGHKACEFDIKNDQATAVSGLNTGAALKLAEILRIYPASGDDFIVVRKEGEDCHTGGDDFVVVRVREDGCGD